jgi:hypothetical protein
MICFLFLSDLPIVARMMTTREMGMEKHKTGKTLHKPRRKSAQPAAKSPGLKKPASGHEPRPQDLPVLLLYNIDPAWEPPEQDEAVTATQELIEALRQVGHPVTPVQVNDLDLRRFLSPYNPNHFVVLNWCEAIPGIAHSDALAAETLEEMGFTYSGSPPSVLRLSGDKEKVKDVLHRAGVPIPQGCVCPAARHVSWERFPAIVKPVHEHCSIGITPEAVVLDLHALRGRISFVTETYRQPALVEEFIDGREFRVTLWGNEVLMGRQVHAGLAPLHRDPHRRTRSADHGGASPARKGLPDRLPGHGDPGLRPLRFPASRRRLLPPGPEPQPRHQLRRQPGPHGGALRPLLRPDGQPAHTPRGEAAPGLWDEKVIRC